MELVGLGLPLQGPGWTEYARVRGYVGVQVKRGTHCVHVAPSDMLKIAVVHVLGHLQHFWCVIDCQVSVMFTLLHNCETRVNVPNLIIGNIGIQNLQKKITLQTRWSFLISFHKCTYNEFIIADPQKRATALRPSTLKYFFSAFLLIPMIALTNSTRVIMWTRSDN